MLTENIQNANNALYSPNYLFAGSSLSIDQHSSGVSNPTSVWTLPKVGGAYPEAAALGGMLI